MEKFTLSDISNQEEELSFIEGTTKSIQDVQSRLTKLRELVINLNEQLQSIREEKTSISSEKDSLAIELQRKAADYDALTKQFEGISTEFQSIQSKEETSLDVRQLLSLYVALVEDIYAARPHIRILWMLHGPKGTIGMTRQEVTKASGFEPAAVLAAIHDLANSGFLGYNAENQQITLERRIFK